ncbi:ABC transporter permease [Mycobacterium sp. E3251]|uniref:ABC transporter permease n=1 Tax=unclassified Mycobacterium TaxID=2642494 RepID=UPI0007FC6BD4|nr:MULTISPECIES: ABC transporter permease [unclassified Mycobacterium]OBG90447.1 ABC transporter permease [Mycobacterium sp. E3251]OBI35170.1 ABC transporter permease [Mycobacterium sp. E1386]
MSAAPAAHRLPNLTSTLGRLVDGWNRLGSQTAFYVRALGFLWEALSRYRIETLRLIANMSLGVGALAMIGGTVVIVTTLTMSTGGLVGIQLFRSLSDVGVQALSGFASAYINTRLASPLIADVGLAATIGAGATAQLGAMRINEEVDALEVMGIHSISYLVSTRVVAGVLVVIPLWCMATLSGYLATRSLIIFVYGQSPGVFDHYFRTYLQPTDLIWSLLQVIAAGSVIMLVHTYYGFHASGGPAGVGEAVGRAVRTSLTVAVAVTLAVALAAYGVSGNFHLSG